MDSIQFLHDTHFTHCRVPDTGNVCVGAPTMSAALALGRVIHKRMYAEAEEVIRLGAAAFPVPTSGGTHVYFTDVDERGHFNVVAACCARALDVNARRNGRRGENEHGAYIVYSGSNENAYNKFISL